MKKETQTAGALFASLLNNKDKKAAKELEEAFIKQSAKQLEGTKVTVEKSK